MPRPSREFKLKAFLEARKAQRTGEGDGRPAFVPSRVHVTRNLYGEVPLFGGRDRCFRVMMGEHDCTSNAYGAISVVAENGKPLGLRPHEFVILDWTPNPHLTPDA